MVFLGDALQELTKQLDVLCVSTQSRLFTRLARQLTRLVQCEDRVRAAVLTSRQARAATDREHERLVWELEDVHTKNKKLMVTSQREKQERNEEKEWLAALWPDEVVLPTILKPYAPEPTAVRFVSQVEAQDERRRLEALVRRRAARERVLQQMETAAQWKMVVVPPSTTPEGEYVATQTFYQNARTGESVWEPPVAMFYEPPTHWDHRKMDWKDSYALDNFYASHESDLESAREATASAISDPHLSARGVSTPPVAVPGPVMTKPLDDRSERDEDNGDDDDDDTDDGELTDQDKAASTSRARSTARTGRSADDGEEPPDPVLLRVELERAFDRAKQLQEQLTKSIAEQRALALQLLNATRDSFEQEREVLAQEDAQVKDAERQRRKALKEEEAAAKAKAQAQERKAMDKAVQPKFARDAVAKKDMTLSKDDELLEHELELFAIAQRKDRLYLAAPLARDERVKHHRQYDDEFVHMKHMEEKQLEVERIEFDLLEKTAHRLELATTRCEELKELLVNAHVTQTEVERELARLPDRIALLEEPTPPPNEPRPAEEVLVRARERYIVASDEAPVDKDDGQEPEANASILAEGEREEGEEEEEQEDDDYGGDEEAGPEATPNAPADQEALARDEAELKSLREAVELDRRWREWELGEVMRLEELPAMYDRFKAQETTKRRLAVDLALLESDLQFFEQLMAREKQTNEMLWSVQASSQVERARFLIERAAREESIFQVQDEYEAVVQRLDDARRLPRQARNPLEKLQLIEESKQKAQDLQRQLEELRTRFEKEQDAKRLLATLETRFHDYTQTKLQEEVMLFDEKQALWDLARSLQDDLRVAQATIESSFAVLQGENPDGSLTEADARGKYDEATAVFQEKLQRLESVRQFLLLCYQRETRWRSLAAIALVKDTSSDEWMTQMQRERQDHMLATLQQQHDAQLQGLRREIKLLNKVKLVLQSEIDQRDAKLDRLRHEYQQSSEAVRLETEQIILGLKAHLQHEEDERVVERQRAKEDRARLLADHEQLTAEMQQRIAEQELENEQQWHWLTAARRELHTQRVANDELLVGYQSLEKRRATETNDMRFRIGSQITKINGIEMWNLALKIQAREAHAERVKMQREIQQLVEHHKQQQRMLRLANWRHRVTAQAILTDVDTLFAFFAHGLEIVAGATLTANDALRRNGGIEVLASLAQHSCQYGIRVIAAKALGQIAWNANVTPRSLGWKAKKLWFQYEQRLSSRVQQELAQKNLVFDSVANESSSEMNWLADTSMNGGGAGESDTDAWSKQHKQIRFLQRWNARDDIERPDVNSANQEYIGLAPSVLKTILDLCRPQAVSRTEDEGDLRKKIQRNALRSLAIVAMDTRNTAIVGRMDGCIPLLVDLLRQSSSSLQTQTTSDDAAVVRHAIHALANLAFENSDNQLQICHAGAIPLLLENVARHSDVDMLLGSVQALAHLSFQNLACCEAIFDAKGITMLTQLCHSYRIHDVIDLEVYESIQTSAAETISNVITTLDGDSDPTTEPQDHQPNDDTVRSRVDRDVALAILAASDVRSNSHLDLLSPSNEQARAPGVATFVLMCASCTRDVAFHGALVLGSIAQHDDVRAAIGACGGIDALFLLTRKHHDVALVAQATWALANATWNRENQYRIARYLDPLYELATFHASNNGASPPVAVEVEDLEAGRVYAEQIREHALCILANALFYNDANRQLVASQTTWMTLLQHNCRTAKGSALDHSARALCSLSYSDSVALALGGSPSVELLAPARAVHGLELFVKLCGHRESVLVQKHGLYGIINVCLHDANKAKLLEIPHGIETLVNLSGSTNRELCDPAIEALDLLADVRTTKLGLVGSSPAAVLSPSTMSSLAANDLKKLITMLQDSTSNPALVAMASDAIADEVWKKPSAKVRLRNEHGLDTLLELCVSPQSAIAGHERVLLSCLWALRNSIADNARNQDYVGALGGIPRLVELYDRHRHRDDVVEAVLAVLVTLVMTHARNSQELVQCGVDMLLVLAEGVAVDVVDMDGEEEEARRELGSSVASSPSTSPPKKSSSTSSSSKTRGKFSSLLDKKPPTKENCALAKELLLLLAPYNSSALPPLTNSTSPEKLRPGPPKKPLHAVSPTRLPSIHSPLAAHVSPSKRQVPSNN